MKDSQYVMYLWHETEMRSKEKEDRKKKKQNQKIDVDNEGKKGKNQHSSVEKTIVDKEHEKDINEMEAAKPGATTYNVDNNAGIDVSYGPKSVHEPAKECVVQSPSITKRRKLADEDVGTSHQQNYVSQA